MNNNMNQNNQMYNNMNQANQMNYQNMMNNINMLLNQMNNGGQTNTLNQNQENNEIQEEHEFIKYVLEGMGEESSDNLIDDMDIIFNYVPSFDSDKYITFPGCTGNFTTVRFRQGNGIPTELTVPEDAKLKDVFNEYRKKLKLNDLNKVHFLVHGEQLNKNSEETLINKNIDANTVIVVISVAQNFTIKYKIKYLKNSLNNEIKI